MTSSDVDPSALLFLLQVSGGAFPTGAFAHSVGFETLIDSGEIDDAASFESVAMDWVSFALAPVEGVAAALAYRAAAADSIDQVTALDQQLTALKPAREAYEASTKMGRAFLDAALDVGGGPALASYRERIARGDAAGHSSVAFALGCLDHGVPPSITVVAFLQSSLSALALVAARLIPIGQRDVQRILYRAQPVLLEAARRASESTTHDMGSAAAAIDVGAMRHERLRVRLCIS